MACPSMKEKLSTYLDGMLEDKEKTEVEEHLRTCEQCRQYYDELTTVVHRLKDIEELQSPPWLKQKVMAAIREEAAAGRSFWKRLLYPLHLKIPAGAVAMIAVAVIATYIFREVEPEVRLAKAPEQEVARPAAPETAAPVTKPLQGLKEQEPKKDTAIPAKEARAKTSEEDKKALSPESRVLTARPAQQAPGEAFVDQDRTGLLLKENAKKEMVKSIAPAPAKILSSEKAEAEGIAKASGVKKKEALPLSIAVREIEADSEDIKKAVSALGGTMIREESGEKRKVLFLDMPSSQLNSLLERLRSIGEITQAVAVQEGAPLLLSIRIEVFEKGR